jgi:hypothetical protein
VYALAILTVASTHLWGANIVINGSFETPSVAPGSAEFSGAIPGWTLASGPSFEIQNNFNGNAFSGMQNAELDSEGNSVIYQDLTTTPGNYVFSFAYSARPNWEENTIQVFWNGALLDTLNASGTGLTNTSWTVHSYNVNAIGTSARIQFAAAGTSDSLGGYVDDVNVNAAVPEPASAGVCLAALAALLGYRRKVFSKGIAQRLLPLR